jgi:methylenetetrahydrofolate reductase (NADPH)
MKITDIINKKKFTVSVEIVPPRNGNDIGITFDKIAHLKGYINFISVTKGAGGSLRGGTLPLSYFIQEKLGISTIEHYVCRERTIADIENDLWDMHLFGVQNILALRGDKPAKSHEHWKGAYKYAYLLIKQIESMNSGKYLPRKNIDTKYHKGIKTDFCVFVAGHPEDPIEEEIWHMKKKVKAGANGIITQMIFSYDKFHDYKQSLRKAGIKIPIIPGIRPIKSLDEILSIEKFFKLKIPLNLKQGIKNYGEKFASDYFVDLIKKIRKDHGTGVHLFMFNDIDSVPKFIHEISSS